MVMKSEIQVFREYIRGRRLRRTPEREQILQEIFEIHGHFDVDELHLKLRDKGSKVSKASIYRALPLFMDCGLVREVDFSDGHWHYEHIYGHARHSHLRCLGWRSAGVRGAGNGTPRSAPGPGIRLSH